MNQHTDTIMSYKSLVTTAKIQGGPDDTFFLNSLSLTHSIGTQIRANFAAEALNLCRSHPILKGISRICVARKAGAANRLVVLESSTSSDISNTIYPGYSCFTDSSGSLEKIRAGSARFFQNSKKVVETFKEKERKPQRSIFRVEQMGFQSGACLPIHSNKRDSGYLFLNSKEEGFFELTPHQSFLLQALGQAATVYMSSYGNLSQTYYRLSDSLKEHNFGKEWKVEKFKALFSEFFPDLFENSSFAETGSKIEGQLLNERPKVGLLTSYSDLLQIVARIKSLFAEGVEIQITQEIPKFIRIEMNFESKSKFSAIQLGAYKEIEQDAILLGYLLSKNKDSNHFELKVPFDIGYIGDDSSYSIEYTFDHNAADKSIKDLFESLR